ncbi:Predicted flavoprotein CzcO associated with the cation diffusion facilitator CzcD [Nakamurella panacisegetis]|uniref:Predicted flavoprotein CzcO associated with the cation diffusion facilitator CzcD n=1 Tax=Nakamurella panacisegetis TaxID=1090615 RepID=A0A1H0SUR7_9ACTN|nr:NAD(P)/FAD-dependent oxidoreductase [Nakamurella panacisegetis]SDP45339.1 Predicted flavoprotein CzcO associated with the cation diffusion facilitator CzcD [Nakamurella panacisegetis]
MVAAEGEPRSHVDVLIVGAGLSGIGAACTLQTHAPDRTWAVVEARGASGGTWDRFRFPGIRSDSDMYTLGYRFRPWVQGKSIAAGSDILSYLRETAAAYGVADRIEYHWRVLRADFNRASARWTVTVEHTETGRRQVRTCGFLYLCTGYFRYDHGYTPSWPGREDFTGCVVHPQDWPADLDVDGREVVVIGSGSTAVTLIPALVAAGAHVVMLQRSPSWVMVLPTRDPLGSLLLRILSPERASGVIRWKNMRVATALYQLCQRFPRTSGRLLRHGVRRRLPKGFDVDRHFRPTYDPWDQRLCLVPDGDFFAAISSGRAEIATDHVESFASDGLRLRSGRRLKADIVVTATGLELLTLGDIALSVDRDPVDVSERVVYKGTMLDGVPNLGFAIGYTNGTWALKVELATDYVTRLLNFMRDRGYDEVMPLRPIQALRTTPYIEMSSGYFERGRSRLPRQGDRPPWRIHQQYPKDARLLRGPIAGPELAFRVRSGPS